MDLPLLPPNPSPNEYAAWFNDRIRLALLRCRLDSGLSPRALGFISGINPETFRNIERGKHSPKLVTVALTCHYLGHRAELVVQDAFREQPPSL